MCRDMAMLRIIFYSPTMICETSMFGSLWTCDSGEHPAPEDTVVCKAMQVAFNHGIQGLLAWYTLRLKSAHESDDP